MPIRAVSFDIGHTLVWYPHPINWQAHYPPALVRMGEAIGFAATDGALREAAAILSAYNTREHPRQYEVRARMVFGEILDAWSVPLDALEAVQDAFFGYFQTDATPFEDAEEALRALREKGIKTGALTDVAYGMDSARALRDIAPIRALLSTAVTSADVGYRKPHPAGFRALLDALSVSPAEMLYVGDEPKDIEGANRLGIGSVLVCREGVAPDYGQGHTVRGLADVVGLV